ncbi:MAG: lipopolysaccharide assembly protein LapA domain-containing protein [Myxococcales bacterium]|nr:lipopolysaccharide assembly protein LapA domain-containing protein [Myxococcales bacterium]MDH3482998.1 lipopolysaccharide assembly protein LapA domain-containing protein [Myxococcales bacterium]
MRQLRVIGIWTLVIFILLFVLSNWDTVRVSMVGMQIFEAPASLVILVAVGLGMALGILVSALRRARRKT